jgi:hypothetical protein
MNRCFFQRWEESERGCGIRPDGCSLHINYDSHLKYLNYIYNDRQDKSIPHQYDKVLGGLIECFVSDILFNSISDSGSIRLMEHEMNNLISLQEIIFKT